MKAKTKKKIVRTLTRKKLVKKKHSKQLFRAFFIIVTAACTGSLVFAVTTTKPTVNTDIRTQLKTHSVTITPPAANASGTPVVQVSATADQVGRASWYALGLRSPDAQTCASRTFPRGTFLQVTNLSNGRKVICLVNDYGPEAWTNRVIDLSRGSFMQVDSLGRGTIPVEIRISSVPPQSLNLNIPTSFGYLTGYSLCRLSFSGQYCDTSRQDLRLPPADSKE